MGKEAHNLSKAGDYWRARDVCSAT